MNTIRWERFPLINRSSASRSWLLIQFNLRLAANTIEAFGRALEDFLAFCTGHSVSPELAKKDQLAAYVHELSTRPNALRAGKRILQSEAGLANAGG